MKKLVPIFAFAAFLFASCASSPSKVFVTNTKRVALLPTDAISSTIEEYQLFSGKFGENEMSMPLFLQADSNGIQIMILNDFGIEMGGITYDGESADLDSPLFPKKIKPEYILLDLQNAYADFDRLKEHYAKSSLIFEEEQGEDGTVRRVKNGKNLIEQIEIKGNSVKITNVLREYEYRLQGEDEDE